MTLTVLLLATMSCAADFETAFQGANKLYEGSRFAEAAAQYERLRSERPHSAVLHYNLGNAYFRINTPGSLGRAIASYERAFSIRPRDPDIRHNLEFALGRAGETLIPAGMPPSLFSLFHLLSDEELAFSHWLGFWLSCLLGSAFLLWDRRREGLRPWLTAAAVFWLSCGAWWGMRKTAAIPSAGVIVSECEARSGPGGNFAVSFKLPEGRIVSRLETRNGFVEIGVMKEGLKGWVPTDSVEAVF
ncbi:MAG: tetratricopeptide repeat protein [Elusimicrobiota bacterium]